MPPWIWDVWMDGVVRGTWQRSTGMACFAGVGLLHLCCEQSSRLSAGDIHGTPSLCLTCDLRGNAGGEHVTAV